MIFFYLHDKEIILKIKPVTSSSDFYIWNHTRSGEYPVRSGYWLAEREAKKEAFVNGNTLPSLNGIKEYIWSIDTEPKNKKILWKAISGALPVADKLSEKNMKADTRCQVCGLEGESVNHVLFTCTVPKQTWALSHFPSPSSGFDPNSVFSNIFYVLKTRKNHLVPEEIRRAGAWILWELWKNRNAFFFEGTLNLGPPFINSIYKNVDNWFLIKSIEKQEKLTDLKKKKKNIFGWKPPPISWLKCGCAWDKIRRKSRTSWILSNREGKIILHGRWKKIIHQHPKQTRCFSRKLEVGY